MDPVHALAPVQLGDTSFRRRDIVEVDFVAGEQRSPGDQLTLPSRRPLRAPRRRGTDPPAAARTDPGGHSAR